MKNIIKSIPVNILSFPQTLDIWIIAPLLKELFIISITQLLSKKQHPNILMCCIFLPSITDNYLYSDTNTAILCSPMSSFSIVDASDR